MPASAEAQYEAIERLIQGWSAWTPQSLLPNLSEDCTQQVLPFRFGAPVRTKAELQHLFPVLMGTLTNLKMNVHNIVHDAANSKAVIYTKTTGDTPFGPYQNEQSLWIWINDECEICKIEEMSDSAAMSQFQPKFMAYVESLKDRAEPEP